MPKLRIGCVTRSCEALEPWMHRLLERISKHASLKYVAMIEAPAASRIQRVNPLLKFVSTIESKILARPVAAETTSPDIKKISVQDRDTIRAMNLDVIIDFDGNNKNQALAEFTNWGIWYFNFSDQPEAIAGFWEVYNTSAVSRFYLCRYDATTSKPHIISSAAVNIKFSAARNALFIKEKCIALMMRELIKLQRTKNLPADNPKALPTVRGPSTLQIINYVFKLAGHIISYAIITLLARSRFRPDMFYLMSGEGSVPDFDVGQASGILPIGNNYWADPFLYERKGKTYIFFETYNYSTRKGHISVGCLEESGFRYLGDVITADYHLSFPFLFDHDGELYMLPETSQAKRLEIWRCIDFPLQWELHKTAFEGVSLADSILLNHKEAWWLFTNLSHDVFEDHCSELYIYKIDGPDLNHIEAHQNNPVLFNSRIARNAGPIQERHGKLYRPSQDNAFGCYGYGLNIMEIEDLSLTEYREKPIRYIGPKSPKSLKGAHHFDTLGGLFILDAQKKRGGRG